MFTPILNALLILHSLQTAQPTQASAFISTEVSYSQAGNTKTMETARMWHSEILLWRLVSLLLNKALHGVSSAHDCCSLSFALFLSLSRLYPLPLYTHYFSAVGDPFSFLCVLLQGFSSCLLLPLFPTFPFVSSLLLLLLLSIRLQILHESVSSVFEVIAAALTLDFINYPQKVC